MIHKRCNLSCCVSPMKQKSVSAIRKEKKRKIQYKLPYTSLAERQTTLVLFNLGHTFKEIGKVLNISAKTVGRQLNKFQKTGSFLDKPKSGRPKKITEEIEKQLIDLVEGNRKRTSGLLKQMLEDANPGFTITEVRIRAIMKKHGYFGGVCARKPLLREVNKAKRLAFARKHRNKPMSFWIICRYVFMPPESSKIK